MFSFVALVKLFINVDLPAYVYPRIYTSLIFLDSSLFSKDLVFIFFLEDWNSISSLIPYDSFNQVIILFSLIDLGIISSLLIIYVLGTVISLKVVIVSLLILSKSTKK